MIKQIYLDVLQSKQIFLSIIQSGDKVNVLVLRIFTKIHKEIIKITFMFNTEIILICWYDPQYIFLLLSILKIVVLCLIFCGNQDKKNSGLLMNRKFKRAAVI